MQDTHLHMFWIITCSTFIHVHINMQNVHINMQNVHINMQNVTGNCVYVTRTVWTSNCTLWFRRQVSGMRVSGMQISGMQVSGLPLEFYLPRGSRTARDWEQLHVELSGKLSTYLLHCNSIHCGWRIAGWGLETRLGYERAKSSGLAVVEQLRVESNS